MGQRPGPFTRVFDRHLTRWVHAGRGAGFQRRFALANGLWWRTALRATYEPASGLYRLVDGAGATVYVAHPPREAWYRAGLAARFARLRSEYFLDQVPFRAGDRIIDAGANVGDVTRAVQAVADVTSLAVEAEDGELACLTRNVPAARTLVRQAVLWHSREERPWYPANASGDSSLFAAGDAARGAAATTTTLADVLAEVGWTSGPIRLLKLDAEGAEPEVLAGAGDALARIAYISVDVGPERGAGKATTLVPVWQRLHRHGFMPVAYRADRHVLLFQGPAAGAHGERAD